jgi:LytS/YehU family sensor histidine kinase
MPYFFFRKRFLIYIVCSLAILTGSQLFRGELDRIHFNKILHEEKRGENRDTFQPGRMPPPPMMHEKGPPELKGPPRGIRFIHFSVYSIILVYLASISIRFIQKWQDDEKRHAEIERERISNELLFLKQQVNPHFLFNALNSVYSLTLSTSRSASNAILKLSSILRYMLYETENKMVDLRDEIAIISDYIDLQKLRLPENVKLNYVVKGEVENLKIAPLLLIPLIENAFKYGADNIGNSFIDIMLTVSGGKLELLVRNQVVGRTIRMEKDSGIGIKNIKRQLDLLYPGNYFFNIDQNEGIFTVLLQIVLQE